MNGNSAIDFPGNSRVHIGLAVTDLERSTAFYRTLLGAAPTKERPGYAKFEPEDPPVNLSLNETAAVDGSSGRAHYGVQVKSTGAVREALARLARAGLPTSVEENTTCCYAVQDKVWATDPDGNQWEVFVVTDADADLRKDEASACCSTLPEGGRAATPVGASTSSCC